MLLMLFAGGEGPVPAPGRLVDLSAAKAHLRLEADYPDAQVEPYLDAAIEAAEHYLNCNVFATQAALDLALDAMPVSLAVAQATYNAAVLAAVSVTDATLKQATLEVACARLEAARRSASWTLAGVVLRPAIRSAILLTLAHLFANRSDVVIGTIATDLPRGARDLLRPLRRVMGP